MKHMYNDGLESNPRMEKCFKCGFSMSPFRGHSFGFGVLLLPRSTVALNHPTFFNIKLCSSLPLLRPAATGTRINTAEAASSTSATTAGLQEIPTNAAWAKKTAPDRDTLNRSIIVKVRDVPTV